MLAQYNLDYISIWKEKRDNDYDHVLEKTFAGKREIIELGFQLYRQRSHRFPSVVVTYLDFAEDLALPTEEIQQAQQVLDRLETEAEKVGLQ